MRTVDLQAIRANTAALRAVAGSAELMAVVKDNAYGHGLVPVARATLEAGATWLGIVHLEEGAALRRAGITAPILMLGYVEPGHAQQASVLGIDIPVMGLEHARALASALGDRPLRVHLKLETGLHRFGLGIEELRPLLDLLANHPNIEHVGTYSHFAAVEEAMLDHAERQLTVFAQCLEHIPEPGVRHIAATAATFVLPASRYDLTRCGIGLYGLWPSSEIQARVGGAVVLRPALRWEERIRAVKDVEAGTPVGYGCAWVPRRPSRVALLDVGYADGLPRSLSNVGVVEVRGHACPIVGRICSNVTFVDVTLVPDVRTDDSALLIGGSTERPAALDRQAERAGMINYELAIRLPDVPTMQYLG